MKNLILALIKNALGYAALGAIVMVGMITADWLIPDPPRTALEVVHTVDNETRCLAEKGGAK